MDRAGGLPKPICCGGAFRRPCSTLARARSAMKLMLLIISSRRDCSGGGRFGLDASESWFCEGRMDGKGR